MIDVEEALQQILVNQKNILEALKQEERAIRNLEARIQRLEGRARSEADIPPSLMRVLKGLVEVNQPLSASATAKQVKLSRNLTSGYLNKLVEKGYVLKEPNLESGGPRYLFRADLSKLPDHLRKIISEYEA